MSSFLATSFLELWKRRQAVIAWEWDLQNAEDDEESRPEFESSVKTFRMNPVTRRKEPYMPSSNKNLRFAISAASVLFMVIETCCQFLKWFRSIFSFFEMNRWNWSEAQPTKALWVLKNLPQYVTYIQIYF